MQSYCKNMADTFVIEAEPLGSRWRPLYQWFLTLPHLLYTGLLGFASVAVALAAAVTVTATGRVPQRLLAFLALALRERVRTFSSLWLLRSSLPPYPTTAAFEDPGDDDRVVVSFPSPPTRLPRLTALARFVVVIPAGIVLQLLGLLMDLTYPLWVLVAVANDGLPPRARQALIEVERAVVTVLGYVFLLSDERPLPFTARKLEIAAVPGP